MKRTICLLIAALMLICATLACAKESAPADPAASVDLPDNSVKTPAAPAATAAPTAEPTEKPTVEPTEEPTPEPTEEPTPEPTEEPTVPDAPGSRRVYVAEIDAEISLPEGYVIFGEDNIPTDEMLASISFPEAYGSAKEFIEYRCRGIVAMVYPGGKPMYESLQIMIRLSDEVPASGDSLANLSEEAYDAFASAVAESFGADGYETVEGNGMRFVVCRFEKGSASSCAYVTAINGKVYKFVGSVDTFHIETVTVDQQAALEYIALSMRCNG